VGVGMSTGEDLSFWYDPTKQPIVPDIEVHTSDRILFKQCRRRWNWQSPIRDNLVRDGESAGPLWLGSGIHFALEDYHGWNQFVDPTFALEAYYRAYYQAFRKNLPENAKELVELGSGMLRTYQDWIKRHQEFRTVWCDGKPMVEVRFKILLPLTMKDGRPIYYVGTLDRILQDGHGRFWVLDYKTAARLDTGKLDTDSQVSAYSWAADLLFADRGWEFEGVVYIQLLKDVPEPPRVLRNGMLSTAKNQRTTYDLYRKALQDMYPSGQIPDVYRDVLTTLATEETPEGNRFIRRDIVRRNKAQIAAEYNAILQEVSDMINPDLPMYKNPSAMACGWCPFHDVCVGLDDGSDWKSMLDVGYIKRGEDPEWRSVIRYPEPNNMIR
jgi:hypothetical protein